jgi:hypothetical protein
MTTATFQSQVRQYSHLPEVFLMELARVAEQIPDEQRETIIFELDASAERELTILSEGYKIIADAEKKLRGEVEVVERTEDMAKADSLLQ